MASVFLGINDRTFTYESTAARAEHVGAGVRYPIDFAPVSYTHLTLPTILLV